MDEETHTFLNEASAHEKGKSDCSVRLEAWDSDGINTRVVPKVMSNNFL